MPLDDPMSDLPSFPSLGGAADALTRKEKAAIVVRLLLSHGAVPALSQLSESKQTELAIQIARMAPVDQETVHAVAEEFASEIERIALSFPEGLDGALGLLDGVLSEGATNRLRKMAPADTRRNPWPDIDGAEADRLAPFVEGEAVEVAAVILSKLSTSKAAEVLGKLPGDHARRITVAISQTASVSPAIVHRIGTALAEQLDARPVTAFDDAPVARAGAILNYAPARLRDEVLTGIEREDRAFADELRAAIFTFANIAERIAPRDVPRVQRDIEQADLALVVAGTSSETDRRSIDFLLANISKRMAENIRDEAKEIVDPKPEDVEAAMVRIVGLIRDLEARGEIFFTVNDTPAG